MNEEEKKAIELLKKLQKKTPYIIWGDGTPYNKSNQIQTILNVIDRQQKEIEDWFEIADNILRATNDYGNITIGDIPKYIENQQKEIKKEKSRIMELAELLDKQENEIKFLKGELEIQEGRYISKDKIKEWIDRFELEEDLQDKYDELLGSDAIYKFLKKLLEEK